MKALLGALAASVALIAVLSLNGGAQPLQTIPDASDAGRELVVAELFTSQSCSSCPPAEALFAELSDRKDLIVLEWHVDYWDRLVHGRAGSWKDPYSDAEYTKRQRDYNRALRGTGAVYTPQAVINGAHELIGSRRSEIEASLVPARHATADISAVPEGELTRVNIGEYVAPLTQPADILQLTLLPDQTTHVPRGENRGVTLRSKNIVLSAKVVGTYEGTAESLSVTPPASNERCAIIIQERRSAQLGPIIGAGYCS